MRQIRGGSIAAFEELFREFHAPLCEVVDSYVQSQAVAEEIVQDLFLVLWLKRETMAVDSLRGYLFTSARNRALHHLRHQSLARRWARWFESRPEVAGIAGAAALPDAAAQESERRVALRAAIEELPPRARLAMLLQWEHGQAHAEIAVAMGISIKGVEKLLSIARRRLRIQLEPHAG
jgi:RNA polymerase sigma-70 factor (ECF subfamily)